MMEQLISSWEEYKKDDVLQAVVPPGTAFLPDPQRPHWQADIIHKIVGLGNPGAKYNGTRHNTGFMALDALAEKLGARVERLQFKALTGDAVIGDGEIPRPAFQDLCHCHFTVFPGCCQYIHAKETKSGQARPYPFSFSSSQTDPDFCGCGLSPCLYRFFR